MSDISVANTTAQLSGKTIPTAEGDYTVTGLHTFDRDPSPPFAVTASSAVVPNLDADKLDGQHGPTGAIVGTTDTQTLSGKTLASPQITGAVSIDAADTWAFGGTVGFVPAAYVQAGGSSTVAHFGGAINVDSTQAATAANTSNTLLFTYTVPANALNSNGRLVKVTAWGRFGATSSDKTVRLTIGGLSGTSIMAVTTAANGTAWKLTGLVIRTGSGTQDLIGEAQAVFSVANTAAAQFGTATQTDTAAFDLCVTAQNGSAVASDTVYEGSLIEFMNY